MSQIDFIAVTADNEIIVATITIRKLDDDVKRRLRLRGAQNGRSMEAEARAILTNGVMDRFQPSAVQPRTEAGDDTVGPFDQFVGKWKGRMTTEQLMALTRGGS